MDVAQDILVVDADPAVRSGLTKLLRDAGLEVTAVAGHDVAQDQLANRFFAAMLVELDGPQPKAGVELVAFARARSPLTAVIVLSSRRTFEALAAAFRAGAFDVIPKTEDHLPYLRERVLEALRERRAERDRTRLLGEVAEVHERFLGQMVALFQRVTDLEERLVAEQDRNEETARAPQTPPLELLVVDPDPVLPNVITTRLGRNGAWRVRAVESGGAALDAATQRRPQVLLTREVLPDLPASMLVKTLSTGPEMTVLIYRPPSAAGPGEVRLVEGGHSNLLLPTFETPEQLLTALAEIAAELGLRQRERRQLAAFRTQHADFLKLYTGLKQRLAEKPRS